MKEYKVKKKKIKLLTKTDYEKIYHNNEKIGKSVDFIKKEAGRAVTVNSLYVLMGLIITIPIMIFESVWLGLGIGSIILFITIYKLVKSIKIRKKYKNREQAINDAIEDDKESLIYKYSKCASCSNKIEICLNVFQYECGKCKKINNVRTAVNTEVVAGSLPIRKLLANVDKEDYRETNKLIINYLHDNPSSFKHKCKCRTTNEFQEAVQQFECPHCGSLNSLKTKVL